MLVSFTQLQALITTAPALAFLLLTPGFVVTHSNAMSPATAYVEYSAAPANEYAGYVSVSGSRHAVNYARQSEATSVLPMHSFVPLTGITCVQLLASPTNASRAP